MAEVFLEHVYKVYEGKVEAVRDFCLDIKDREFMVFVGPSGCGKSTTLRMIAGLEEITKGEVRIGDRVVNDVAPKDRDIAMVFQNYALYPHMTVYDNMAFGLKLRKYSREEINNRVMEAAKILGLEEYLNRCPKQLSGGQRQRVAVGRAIVRKPKAFLFDEPLSNLDAKMRVQMRTEISKLHQQLETTMIYVTHDQTEAMTMGDRICVMKDGVIQQVAAPIELYDKPCNKFVAGFIGIPPMNFFEGNLANKDGKLIREIFYTIGYKTAEIEYEYDKSQRLTKVVYIDDELPDYREYEYDKNGNMILQTHYFDGIESSRYEITYDENGDMIAMQTMAGNDREIKYKRFRLTKKQADEHEKKAENLEIYQHYLSAIVIK